MGENGAVNESAANQQDSRTGTGTGMERVALGTAQFGLEYGVSNKSGQTSLSHAAMIVRDARQAGCRTIDTAIAYGQSETRLGEIGVQDWDVVSKLPAFPAECTDIGAWASAQVAGSLERLGIRKLDTLLLHAPVQLSGPRGPELVRALRQVKELGMTRRLGISVYSPEELGLAIAAFPVEVVQAPFNVIDRGLETSGWASRLVDQGVEIHLRSAFLQGLLLMDEGARPAFFAAWQPLWGLWHQWLHDQGTSALEASLSFVLSRPFASRVVVGVTSPQQLGEVLVAARAPAVHPPDALRCDAPGLINPSQWKIK